MEGWLIGFKAKPKPSEEEKKEGKRKTNREYDGNKRKRSFQKSWEVGRPWLQYDEVGVIMFCHPCRVNKHGHAETGSFTAGTSSFQHTSVRAHEETLSHKKECLAVEAASKPVAETAAGQMLMQMNRALFNRMTMKLITVHGLVKHDRPFTDYVWMCGMDEAKGLGIGSDYHSI